MFNVKNIKELPKLLKQYLTIKLEEEKVLTLSSVGRVISKDIVAKEDVPAFNKSTVDGYACIFEDVSQASENSPIALKLVEKVEMGKITTHKLKSGEAIYVPTGGYVPEGATSMIMIEHTELLGEDVIIHNKASMYQHIIRIGQDIQKDQLLIKKNTPITSRMVGALMSQNIQEIKVYKNPNFSIISTGDEITNKKEISVGEVRDINTHTISTYLENKGFKIMSKVVVQDDETEYRKEIEKAFEESNIVISSGGSSVGEKDYTYKILKDLGANIFLHGLNIKPGKPTILATHKDKLFIGLPGHPLSAYIVYGLLHEQIMTTLYKKTNTTKPYIVCTLSENVHNSSGRTLVQLVDIRGTEAIPLYYKSAMINVLKDAYGYIIIDELVEGLYKNDSVQVYKLGD